MTQTRHSDVAYPDDPLHPPRRQARRVAVATGEEVPVASPALELQRALDAMFSATPTFRTDYSRGAKMTMLAVAIASACAVFWWNALHWAASLLG